MTAARPGTTAPSTQSNAGLTEAEAQARLREYGFNEIPEAQASLVGGVLKRLWGPIPWILEIALILEVLVGKVNEPVLIGLWLLFSAVVGGVQERRAQRVLDLLRSRLRVTASARRDGTWRVLPARELVPGDELHLGPGDLVPADCAVTDGTVEVDQSALTGESAVVARATGEVIYSASTVRSGQVAAIVTATGAKSYFGRTAELVRSARSAGHLDQLLFAVVRQLVTIDAVLAALLVAFALWSGADLLVLIPFLLVLVIATVPVTMPAAFTVANAVEARSLARDGVLVTGLSAVQEASTMDVLCVDKTGTLTHNRQVISTLVPVAQGETENDVLRWAAAACNEASQGQLEMSVLAALAPRGIQPPERLQLVPFDPALKRSEAYVLHQGKTLRVVLGSPPAVSQIAGPIDGLERRVDELASAGARILAVAVGPEDGLLVVRGLLAFADTLREDAPALIQAVRNLGVRVLMISGDTVATARAIAQQVGLGDRFGDGVAQAEDPLGFDGFAHCYPQEKFQLVQKLQQAGHVVGMTGDGVNDAPALKQAEVGIAVSSATDVAKASAQVVLTRPGLEDMLAVISSGRRVYRRMLTWTITKIARTIELAVLLTVGYMVTGFFVTSLALIAVLVVLNDVVTITLATDHAEVSPAPEKWSINAIGKVAAILAAGWLILGFAAVWVARGAWSMSIPQTQTLIFVYLIYSAQATIYLTRVRGRFWSSSPSTWVACATIGNAIIASGMAYFGLLAAPISGAALSILLVAVIFATFALDECKMLFFSKAIQ